MESQVCKTDHQIYPKKGMGYWAPLVQKWQTSGMSQRDFCRSHNLSYWVFRNWKKKLQNASPRQTANLVKIFDSSPNSDEAECIQEKCPQESEVRVFFGDFLVEVKRDCSEEALLKVVRALRKA